MIITHLNTRANEVELTKEIITAVDQIVDKYGEIKDNVSPVLLDVRRSMNSVRGKVNQSFGMALTQYNSLGYLDDQGKLCSKSSRISGFGDVPPKVRIHNGSSKTEVSLYIEPEATLQYSRNLAIWNTKNQKKLCVY
jgi:DNA mismatch repair protein MutS2